jgi:hypothetical protein
VATFTLSKQMLAQVELFTVTTQPCESFVAPEFRSIASTVAGALAFPFRVHPSWVFFLLREWCSVGSQRVVENFSGHRAIVRHG